MDFLGFFTSEGITCFFPMGSNSCAALGPGHSPRTGHGVEGGILRTEKPRRRVPVPHPHLGLIHLYPSWTTLTGGAFSFDHLVCQSIAGDGAEAGHVERDVARRMGWLTRGRL